MKRARFLLMALVSMISVSANAGIIEFSDRAAFIAATGATPIGAIPGSVSSANFALGGLSFINDPPSSFNRSVNWSTLISEPFDLAINGVEDYNAESATDLFSFGFDFHEPSDSSSGFPDVCNAPCFDSDFTLTLLDGVTVVGAIAFNKPDDVLAFVGVWSTDPFDRIEIRDVTGTIDNEFFGNFLTGTNPAPEPATIALLGLGLLGLGFGRRR